MSQSWEWTEYSSGNLSPFSKGLQLIRSDLHTVWRAVFSTQSLLIVNVNHTHNAFIATSSPKNWRQSLIHWDIEFPTMWTFCVTLPESSTALPVEHSQPFPLWSIVSSKFKCLWIALYICGMKFWSPYQWEEICGVLGIQRLKKAISVSGAL